MPHPKQHYKHVWPQAPEPSKKEEDKPAVANQHAQNKVIAIPSKPFSKKKGK